MNGVNVGRCVLSTTTTSTAETEDEAGLPLATLDIFTVKYTYHTIHHMYHIQQTIVLAEKGRRKGGQHNCTCWECTTFCVVYRTRSKTTVFLCTHAAATMIQYAAAILLLCNLLGWGRGELLLFSKSPYLLRMSPGSACFSARGYSKSIQYFV